MYLLQEQDISCPFCGEWITIQIDCSVSRQNYVEDCQVCCRPILLEVQVSGEEISVQARPENE